MDFEAKIISKHNLDLSSIESLASDIANRLNTNIEFGDYARDENGHNFISLGTVSKNDNGIVCILYNLQNDNHSNYDYVLELGEEAKLIYKDIISFMPPWEEQYHQLNDNYNNGTLATDSYYSGVFEELYSLGAGEIHFIKESYQPEFEIKNNQTFDNYISHIQENGEFFTVALKAV